MRFPNYGILVAWKNTGGHYLSFSPTTVLNEESMLIFVPTLRMKGKRPRRISILSWLDNIGIHLE